MAPRRLLWAFAVAAAVVMSVCLLVAAGLQRNETRSGTVPGPLPQAPAIVHADLPISAPGIAPAPGVDIEPMEGTFSPR